MAEGIVLTIPNYQCADSGKAPNLVAKGYTSYFENEEGEQLVFTYDKEKDIGALYHGDYGWENPVILSPGSTLPIILDKEEQEWLLLCWKVARAHRVNGGIA